MKTKFLRYKKVGLNRLSSNSLLWFFLLLIILTLIQAIPTMAYRKKPNKDPEQIIATMQEQLELTDVQVERIQPIVQEQSEKRRELFKKYRPQGRQGLSAMREEMQKLRSEMDAQLAEILSDDQIEKYQMLQNQRREQMNQKYRSRDSRSFN